MRATATATRPRDDDRRRFWNPDGGAGPASIRRVAPGAAPAAIALVAVVVRIGLLVSARPYTFDDGVYSASVLAMRHGEVPFREVFSSQGPVFLPSVWLFDLVGLRTFWSPRLAMLAAGAAIGIGAWAIVRSVAGEWTGLLIGVAAASSSAVILAAGPLQSDGIALAFGTGAVAVACSNSSRRTTPVVVGLLAGAALASKSLLIAPAAVAAVVLLATPRGARPWRAPLLASLTAAASVVVVSFPFGISGVWDQYVIFHTRVPRDVDPVSGLATIGGYLGTRDPVVVVLLIVACASLGAAVIRRRTSILRTRVLLATVVWLVGSLAVVTLAADISTGFHRYVAFLVVPALVFVGVVPVRARVVGLIVAVLLPVQLMLNGSVLNGRSPTMAESAAVVALEALPRDRLVITDEPALAWMAQRRLPGMLTDTSYARVRSGSIVPDDVQDAAGRPDTCAVLLWSGRLRLLDPGLPDALALLGYERVAGFGNGRELLARPDC